MSGTEPGGGGPTTTTGSVPVKAPYRILDQADLQVADGLRVMEDSAFSKGEGPPLKEEEPPAEPESPSTVQGPVYTWQDGDRTRQVRLQVDLAVVSDVAKVAEGDVVGRSSGRNIAKAASVTRGESEPVFRSESGNLMSLPGGVVLILDPDWDSSQTDAFFANNGIALDRVSDLGELPNAFLVETVSGFPSLDLANALAGQEGVEVSSPNWWMEATTR